MSGSSDRKGHVQKFTSLLDLFNQYRYLCLRLGQYVIQVADIRVKQS